MDPNQNTPGQEPAAKTEDEIRDAALAAFDEGKDDEPAPPPADDAEAADEPADDAPPAEDAETEADDGAADDQPDAPAQTPEESEAAARAEADKEADALHLKGKARERFHELTNRVAELERIRESLGGEDGIERLRRDAEDQRQWDQRLTEIGCTPQQFGQAMGFVAAINSDDPTMMRQAYDGLMGEAALIAKRLGIKTDQHNPLDEHPDLRDKVQTGLMDEQDALELARLRTHQGAVQQRQQRQAEEQTLAQRQQSALDQMAQWGAEQRANDPDFGRKLAAVKGAIDAALPALPPEQWVQHAAQIIGSVQLPAAAPPQARPRPGRAPMRHSNAAAGAATVTPATPTDPMDAFTQGVEEMRAVGK